ncbi:MAG TPA: DUF1801 domain-containing protein [Chitinophagaceae bacterium]|nr:DUF1801 domain-containing protein [Chitinophagaceae bacterium]
MKTYATVQQYLDEVPDDKRTALEKLRKTIRSVVPKAEEYISYGMPTFKYNGPLVSYAAFKEHCSLFPWGGSLIKKYAEELKLFKTSKGTIQFTIDKPLPVSLVKKIVKERMKENEARALGKKAKRDKV